MSDNQLFAVLLGALALALLLRRFTLAHASKVGLASAKAAIAGVAAAVLGGLLIKFFRGSIAEVPGVGLVVCGFVAMGIGLAVSLISVFTGLFARLNSNVAVPEVTGGLSPLPIKGEKDRDSPDDPSYLEYRLIENAHKEGNPSTIGQIESYDLFEDKRDCDLAFETTDDDYK